MTNICNMTPHTVNFQPENSRSIVVMPSRGVIRIEEKIVDDGFIDEIKVVRRTFTTANVPEPQEGTVFIVSTIVKTAFPDRHDFIVPCDFIRNDEGQIMACKAFAR